MRPYLEIGAAMGWTPADVRACSLGDFFAALDGWKRAQGAADEIDLSDADVRDLLEALENA